MFNRTVRRVFLFALLIGFASLLTPQVASAAGCGSGCNLQEPPECIGCQFTFFMRTMCNRQSCVLCVEIDCWTALPGTSSEQLAGSCPSRSEAASAGPTIVRVETLPARS